MVRSKQKFGSQKGGQRRKSLKELKDTMDKISGGDPVQLLSAYFESHVGKDHLVSLQKNFSKDKLNSLLENISVAHKNAGTKERRQILSLVSPIFKINQLQDAGFKISYPNLQSANNHSIQHGPGAPVPKPTPPAKKRKISDDLQNQIKDFFLSDEISRMAPNRTILKKIDGMKVPTTVQYLECTISNAYQKFKGQNLNIRCSESTFRRYMPKEIKKARRATDMCPICQVGRRKKSKLEKEVDKIHNECDNSCSRNFMCNAEKSLVS